MNQIQTTRKHHVRRKERHFGWRAFDGIVGAGDEEHGDSHWKKDWLSLDLSSGASRAADNQLTMNR